jgi:hypothetical protein
VRGGRTLAQDSVGLFWDIFDLYTGHGAIMALEAPVHKRVAAATVGSSVMLLLGLGEATGEFIEVTGADQAALGGVIAWRHGPVGAGSVAVPDAPPRVLAPEPVKPAGPVVCALAGGHRRYPLIAGAVSLAACWQVVVAGRRAAAGTTL